MKKPIDDEIPLLDQRLAIANFTLSLLRIIHDALLARAKRRFGSDVDLLIIRMTVFKGYAEGRPFTTYKLAQYLDFNLTTLINKLDQLEKLGIVEIRGKHLYPTQVPFTDGGASITNQIAAMMEEACVKLGRSKK